MGQSGKTRKLSCSMLHNRNSKRCQSFRYLSFGYLVRWWCQDLNSVRLRAQSAGTCALLKFTQCHVLSPYVV